MTELGRIEERVSRLGPQLFHLAFDTSGITAYADVADLEALASPALSEIAQRLKAKSEQDGAEAAIAQRALRRLFALARQAEAGVQRMKIRAIRLKEVGRFSAPIAIEGLSGGLDVLVGPNEFGKSTILKALNTALFLPHTSKKADDLRPYAGGAPLIELDLDVQGRSWRLRKQYLSSRSAELRDLSTGQLSRGADAEAQLASLLGGTGHFALLCVEQGTAMASDGADEDRRQCAHGSDRERGRDRCRRQRGALHRRARQGRAGAAAHQP